MRSVQNKSRQHEEGLRVPMFFWKARPFSVGGAPVLPPGARANLNLFFLLRDENA